MAEAALLRRIPVVGIMDRRNALVPDLEFNLKPSVSRLKFFSAASRQKPEGTRGQVILFLNS